MIKKYLPIIILLLIAIPVGLFYIFFRNVENRESRDISFEAVPENAVVLFENQSALDFMETFSGAGRIKQSLGLADELSPFIAGIGVMDSLIRINPDLQKSLKNLPFFFSVHQTGEKKYDFFIVIRADNRVAVPDFERVMGMLGYGVQSVSDRNYIRTKITSYKAASIERTLYYSELKGYILISHSEILVEEGIRQIREGISLQNQDEFKKIAISAGQNVNGNLFINLERFPGYAGRALSGNAVKKAAKMNYGSWLEMDLTIRPDALLLNGFASSGDTLAWLDVLKGQEPQKISIDRVLPANCLSFFALGINDNEQFQDDLEAYLSSVGEQGQRQSAFERIMASSEQNVISQFMGFTEREAGIAYLPGIDDGVEPVAVIGTQSRSMALDFLGSLVESAALKEGKPVSDYEYQYRIDQERRFIIYEMPVRMLPQVVYGPMFAEVAGKYFSFIGNYLIMADSRQALQDMIYFNELNKTLATDPTFMATVEFIVSRSNFYYYTAPFRSTSYYAGKLNTWWDKWIPGNMDFLLKLGSVSLQIQNQPRNGLFFHNLIFKFADNSPDRPETVWESRLETTLNFKPALVTNHNTRDREIIVQDENDKLYLVNSSGRILWSLPMEEAIKSEIFQIDYYRNGRLQYLFSTENKLHLLDREGNYVDKYPITLRSAATNGMALFDYDGSRDYRIFIACEDKHVYLYDKKGSLVKGWGFEKTEGTVNQPVMFKRIGNRDYIIFSDEMRVYILDRRGNDRVVPESQFAKSFNNGLIYEGPGGGNEARLVATDVEGKVYFIYFDGKVESRQVKECGPGHYFEFQDMNKDGKRDFIFMEGNRLEVFNSDGGELFSKKMDAEITHPPAIYRFPGNEKKIGVVTRSREEIYLVNSDGSLYEGFPLRGRTMFSIGYLSGSSREFNLLVGGDNLFLYNYRVK